MKAFKVMALAVLTIVLCTAGVAKAAKQVTAKLTPVDGSPSPGASGTAATTVPTGPPGGGGGPTRTATTKFNVRGLEPNKVYRFEAYQGWYGFNWQFAASSNGSYSASELHWITTSDYGLPVFYQVWTVENGTWILVLAGH